MLVFFLSVFFFQSENTFTTLMLTKWYNFNCENRKIFLLMLCNSVKPISINFSGEIAINYRLGMAVGICADEVRNIIFSICRFAKRYIRQFQFSCRNKCVFFVESCMIVYCNLNFIFFYDKVKQKMIRVVTNCSGFIYSSCY